MSNEEIDFLKSKIIELQKKNIDYLGELIDKGDAINRYQDLLREYDYLKDKIKKEKEKTISNAEILFCFACLVLMQTGASWIAIHFFK
jgi:hypothetical protein